MKKLNLGCGGDIRKGYVNLDQIKLPGVDKTHNLNKFPWPFKDNEFDEILAHQVIEHLQDIPKALRELWRISKNKSKIHIGVPYFASVGAWTDLTHTHPFGWCSLDYMANNKVHKHSVGGVHNYEYGIKEKFNILKRKLVFGKLHKLLGISWFAHRFPMAYELYVPFIFPARHIEFKIETVK